MAANPKTGPWAFVSPSAPGWFVRRVSVVPTRSSAAVRLDQDTELAQPAFQKARCHVLEKLVGSTAHTPHSARLLGTGDVTAVDGRNRTP